MVPACLRLTALLGLGVALTDGVDVHDRATLRALRTLRGGTPGGGAEAGAGCAAYSLCSTCQAHSVGATGDHDCVWCADDGGHCVAATESGEKCSRKGLVLNDYCLHKENCHSTYSTAYTCVSDGFCGWCPGGGLSGAGVCVEGTATGPLTGFCQSWEYGVSSATPLDAAQPGEAAAGSATDVASEDAQIEGELESYAEKAKATEHNERDLVGADTKAWNVVKGIKHIVQGYKTRKEHQITATSHFKGKFERDLEKVMEKRRSALSKIKDLLKQEYEAEIEENNIESLKMKEDEKQKEEESKIVNFFDPSKIEEGSRVEVTEHLFQEEKAMQGLEKFLAKLSHRDKALMKDLKNKAHTNVEHELHTAAARKMAREEAAWYACSYLSQSPEQNCGDFSVDFSGMQKDARDGELTPEEHTRVCNEVQVRLNEIPADKKLKAGLSNDVYLSWCVNHVNVLCAKCTHMPASPDVDAQAAAAVARR